MKKIGEIVSDLIKKSNLSVNEIAEKIGMTNQNLYKILKKDTIESKYLIHFSKILNVDISIFFKDLEQIDGVTKNIKEVTMTISTVFEYYLKKDYISEFEIIDGIKRHPLLSFEEWIVENGIGKWVDK